MMLNLALFGTMLVVAVIVIVGGGSDRRRRTGLRFHSTNANQDRS